MNGGPGPPSTLNDTEKELVKEDILNTLRQEECQLNLCNSCKPTCNGMSADNPAASCKEIYDCNPSTPSGKYCISTDSGPHEFLRDEIEPLDVATSLVDALEWPILIGSTRARSG